MTSIGKDMEILELLHGAGVNARKASNSKHGSLEVPYDVESLFLGTHPEQFNRYSYKNLFIAILSTVVDCSQLSTIKKQNVAQP